MACGDSGAGDTCHPPWWQPRMTRSIVADFQVAVEVNRRAKNPIKFKY
jgi:hypothetical protein